MTLSFVEVGVGADSVCLEKTKPSGCQHKKKMMGRSPCGNNGTK